MACVFDHVFLTFDRADNVRARGRKLELFSTPHTSTENEFGGVLG